MSWPRRVEMKLVHLAALLLGTARAQTGCPSYAGCVDPAPACPVAGQKFEPPLRSVTCCLDADTFEPESACGPAVARRTQFNNDWCARSAAVQAGNLSAAKALRGTVLDIILVPAEDETLYAQPLDGEPAYYYGMVGDALREIAEEGEFEWNAIVVRPPNTEDAYGGSWDKWMVDWTQRADMIAAWMYDMPWRRDMGIDYPYAFYELSPVLLVRETDASAGGANSLLWDRLTFIFTPFDAYLWLALVVAFLIVGILDAFNDGRYHDFGQPGFLQDWLWETWHGFYSALMSFIALSGLGYDGEIGGKGRAGSTLKTFWALFMWLLRAGYTASLARQLLTLVFLLQPKLSTDSFDMLFEKQQTVCVRTGTAMNTLMKQLVEPSRIIELDGGGLAGDLKQGAELVRNDSCAGIAQPIWMAENALIDDGANPSAPGGGAKGCDLRIAYPKLETTNGGYISSSGWLREKSLADAADAGMPAPTSSGHCAELVSDTIGILLTQMASRELRKMRTAQRERLRTNACSFEGKPLDAADQSLNSGLTVEMYLGLIIIMAAGFTVSCILGCVDSSHAQKSKVVQKSKRTLSRASTGVFQGVERKVARQSSKLTVAGTPQKQEPKERPGGRIDKISDQVSRIDTISAHVKELDAKVDRITEVLGRVADALQKEKGAQQIEVSARPSQSRE